jgi:hypothetical protein
LLKNAAQTIRLKTTCAANAGISPESTSKCGAQGVPTAYFCDICGAPLARKSASRFISRDQRSLVEWRHLTVLFCDLVGSTEIAARLDPEGRELSSCRQRNDKSIWQSCALAAPRGRKPQ